VIHSGHNGICASSPHQVIGFFGPAPVQVLKKLVSPVAPSAAAQASRLESSSVIAFVWRCGSPVLLFVSDQRPDDAGVLVGDGYASLGCAEPLLLVRDPKTPLVCLGLRSKNDGSCTMNQQCSPVRVVALADAQ
jgi:hypothetical protein